MSIFDGILNYTIAFTIATIFFVLISSYKKSLKTNLSQSFSSFFSIFLCIYYIFSFNNLYFVYEFISDFKLGIILSVLIVLIIFCFVYLFIKIIIKIVFKYTRLVKMLNQNYPGYKKVNFIFVFMRKSIFMLYIIIIITVFYSQLYYSGVTKPLVTMPIIKSTQIDVLTDISKIEQASYNASSFTELFSTNKMLDRLNLTSGLLTQLSNYEKQFMNNVYPNLSEENKIYISEKMESDEVGILSVLVEDNLYTEILDINVGNFAQKILMKIPYLNEYLYNEEVIINDLYTYINNNSELIIWLDQNRSLIANYKNDKLLLLNQFKEDYLSFKNIKDKGNKDIIDQINLSIDCYYFIQSWSLKIMEDSGITDVEVFLQNGENLDLIIKEFNKDYKNSEFKKFEVELLDAYQLTERYLKDYNIYSKSIKTNIPPQVRIGAAALDSEVKIKKYLYNEKLLYELLIYLNDTCYRSQDVCDDEKIFEIIDILLWGYFTEEIDSTKQIRLSSTKINDFYINIDEMNGFDKASIKTELIKLNNKLYPYIEKNYNDNIFGYEILKVLYKHDNYYSNEFYLLLKILIK